MREVLLTLLLIAILALVFYGLYINGLLTLTCQRAVKFISKNKGLYASFGYCNGFIKRVMVFNEIRPLEFDFLPEITKGEVIVEILDKEKTAHVMLDDLHRHATFTPQVGTRYYLKVSFKGASGKYQVVVK